MSTEAPARPAEQTAERREATPDKPRRHQRRTWLARGLFAVILVAATVVRVAGARFGFPLLLHPDEWAVVEAVVDMAKRNSFEPPWSLRPDHVEMKVDYFLFAGYAAAFKHASIEAAFAQDPLPFYWLARLATAAFGVGTVVLGYLAGRVTSRRLGLVLAALFAFFPPFVKHAHYATPDVPLTFAMMLLVYAMMRYTARPSWPSLLTASFAVALGVAIKYPAATGAVVIALVVVATAIRDHAWKRLLVHGTAAAGAAVGFLFLISPVLFTDFSGIRRELKVQAAGDRLGHANLGLVGNMRFYVDTYLHFSGVVLAVLAVVGLVEVVRRRRLDTLSWSIGIVVWVSLSTLPMTWERWGLPMWITPLMLAGVGVTTLVDKLRAPRVRWIPAVVIGVVAVQLASSVAMVDASLLAPDSRNAAKDYADGHGIRADESTYEGYTPFLPGASFLFFRHQVRKTATGYEFLTRHGKPSRYIVLSSGMDGRVFADPTQKSEQDVYRWIAANGTLVRRFNPMASPMPSTLESTTVARNLRFVKDVLGGGQSGPTISIYKLPRS